MNYSQHDFTELMNLAELAGVNAASGVHRQAIANLTAFEVYNFVKIYFFTFAEY